MGKQTISVYIFLLHALSLRTPSLRSEGPSMSRNFQHIHPVIKNDHWYQSWLHFPDLYPNFDDMI